MSNSRFFRQFLQLSTILLTIHLSISEAAMAGQKNGKTFFDQSPTLLGSAVRNSSVNNAITYEFTLNVPSNAGEPLQAVTISQNPNFNTVDFQIQDSTAYSGTASKKGTTLPLAPVGGPGLPNETLIVFHQPVQPGQTITIALPAQHNPTKGLYVFKVIAYPLGKEALGQVLGSSRMQF